MKPLLLALVLLFISPAMPEPRTEMFNAADHTWASIGMRSIVPDEIHRGVAEWVLRCMGMPDPVLRVADWRVAETIVGISDDVRGIQPLALTQMAGDSAIIVFRREYGHTNFVISHELLHVLTGWGDDDPRFLETIRRCQVRLPFNFDGLPKLPEDSVAVLEALVR